jgi:hypothetical protein
MKTAAIPERLRKFEIPGCVAFASGHGGLPKITVTTGRSAAEIYPHGAHATGFQKNGEPPLLFLSRLSQFAAGKAIRGDAGARLQRSRAHALRGWQQGGRRRQASRAQPGASRAVLKRPARLVTTSRFARSSGP